MCCVQVWLMSGVAIMNSVGAYLQQWPTAYQLMNIPHFLMYIAIVYYLCAKEFYTVAWVAFGLITLATVDFMILSEKIFGLETTMMNRLAGGQAPQTPWGQAPTPLGGYTPTPPFTGNSMGVNAPFTGNSAPYPMAGLSPRPMNM